MIWRRILFYFLSFTWGFIMSFIGLIVIGILACFRRVYTFHGRLYGTVGNNWGGLELGCFFICGKNCRTLYLCAHESGHGIQNIIWGPLGIFVIFIPSCIRYWYREIKYNRKGLIPPTGYDDIWFEGQATRWGFNFVVADKI